MRTVETNISCGYLPLLEIFANANRLVLKFEERNVINSPCALTTILYEEDSDTDMTITFLSYKHLGFENMLVDYLKRCNIDVNMIPIGKAIMKKSSEQMEKEWQEHRKKIGL